MSDTEPSADIGWAGSSEAVEELRKGKVAHTWLPGRVAPDSLSSQADRRVLLELGKGEGTKGAAQTASSNDEVVVGILVLHVLLHQRNDIVTASSPS